MRALLHTELLHTELTALLARANVSQASFAPLTGLTSRSRARGRAAGAIAGDGDPHARRDGFRWYEGLGVAPGADAPTIRRAMTQLPRLYHPDAGGRPEQMRRINAGYDAARASLYEGQTGETPAEPRP